MDLEKILREFLAVIDFKLCSIDSDSIVIEDMKNTDELNQVLMSPIDFKSTDDLRVFRFNKLNNNGYRINVLNTKYHTIPFSKNGITNFDLSISKGIFFENHCVFSLNFSYEDNIYYICLGKAKDAYVGYRFFNSEFIDVTYSIDGDTKKFKIFIPECRRMIYIHEYIDNGKRIAQLVVEQDSEQIYKYEIENNELEFYFGALVHKVKDMVLHANDGMKTLNHNIYEIIFNDYDIALEFESLINSSSGSNRVIDDLFEKYFSGTLNPKAIKFVEQIDKMESFKYETSYSERLGTVDDYSESQEQRDLDNYRMFMNSSDYDSIKDVGKEIPPQKKMTLNTLRKIGLQHEE